MAYGCAKYKPYGGVLFSSAMLPNTRIYLITPPDNNNIRLNKAQLQILKG